MTKIIIPNAQQIVLLNQLVCSESGNPHLCNDVGKIESAVHSAFYPGTYPFAAGGLAQIAGALCFYIVKSHAFMDGNKRTGALAATTFLEQNEWELRYPVNFSTGEDAFAAIIENCAAGNVTKEALMEWFDVHKVEIE